MTHLLMGLSLISLEGRRGGVNTDVGHWAFASLCPVYILMWILSVPCPLFSQQVESSGL